MIGWFPKMIMPDKKFQKKNIKYLTYIPLI